MNQPPSLRALAPLLLAVLTALAVRAPGLGRSLGHDEAYTLEAFASQAYERIATSYAAPNNHILHSLLVRLSVRSLGKSNWTARLPAFAAGVAAIPAVWLAGRALFGSAAVGLVAAWMLALTPVHVSYSQVARGYSLLVLLALLSLWLAHRAITLGNWRPWAAFGTCAFLAAWTVPSGAFHLLALIAWAALLTSGTRRRQALLAGAASGALILLAYLPMRQELASAGGRWGVDVWADPLALPGLVAQTLRAWVGGGLGLLPAIAALVGLVWMARERHRAALYAGLAWGSAMLAALIMGTAGQPRTYIYLLPTFALAAACGLCRTFTAARWRVVAAAAMLAGYGWLGARSAGQTQADPYADLADHLAASTRTGDIVVTPFIMDVRVWSYARDTIGQRLVDALQGRDVHRLVFVTSAEEERFELGSYLLKTNAGPASIELPEEHFELAHDPGTLQLWQLRGAGVPIFPSRAQVGWRVVTTAEGQEVSVTAGEPAIGPSQTIDASNPGRAPFQLYANERFAITRPGLLLLLYARTFRESYASVYSVDDAGVVVRPHMYRTATWPAVSRGRDGDTWYLDAYLLPVDGGREYGIYLLGADVPHQRFTDVTCYHFAYPE